MGAINAFATAVQASQMNLGWDEARKFDEIVAVCLPAFRRHAVIYLRDAADAEDAVQDALLSAYKHLDQFKGGAQLSTWLWAIVINSARMKLRSRSRRLHLSLDEPGEESAPIQIPDHKPNPEDAFRESELYGHVTRLLAQLPPVLRRTFELRDLDGLTTEETAVILGVPEGTVKARLARARKKLRPLLRRSIEAESHFNGDACSGTGGPDQRQARSSTCDKNCALGVQGVKAG